MKYVGIDIGKYAHVAVILDEENNFSKHLKFNSLRGGYEEFTLFLENNSLRKEEIIIGFEATGHYWLTLFQKLKEDGFSAYVLNPLQVKSFRNESIRGIKTDDRDCELIAKVLKFGVGTPSELPEEELFTLKELSRFRHDLSKRIGITKVQAIAVIGKIFPEYEELFFDAFGKASSAILKEYTTADVIGDLDLDTLTQLLKKASNNQFKREQASKLKQEAQNTFGLKYGLDAFSLELKCLMAQIEHLEHQLKLIEKQIQILVVKQGSKLLTVPGISYVTAGSILGETALFHQSKDHDPRSLLAFAGLDPMIKQSGQWVGKARMSKRGSPYLREAIWRAALVASQKDPLFKRIYQKHKSKGKHHGIALSHVAKKLTYVIAAILRENTEYRPIKA